jgi:dynein assembly factor 3, axonemal
MNSSQEIAAAIGFSSFWGFSPACELNKFCPPQKSLNILLVGTSDIRHVMATLSSLIIGEQPGGPDDVHFFISEREKETLARAILLLQVVSEVNIPYQERVDLFLDLWANTFIREKSSKYLDALLPELDRLVSDPGKCQIPVRHVMDLSILKHKERDDLCDVFKSWHSKVPFNMEELRDQRLRFHFKERYDFRKNIVDYDYHNGIREEGPIISYSLYRDWRLNGVAFEQRFSSYIVANRTLSSYTDGRRKDSKTSCLVRGFWGDIVVSPFVGCGLVTSSKPEDEFFYRKQNLQHRFVTKPA